MSRRTRKRRTERRARQAREALQPNRPEPDTPVDWNHLRQRYSFMKGRAVMLSYVLCGPRVQARSPEELEMNTALEIACLMKGEPQN